MTGELDIGFCFALSFLAEACFDSRCDVKNRRGTGDRRWVERGCFCGKFSCLYGILFFVV